MRTLFYLLAIVTFPLVLSAESVQNGGPDSKQSIFDVLNYQEVMEVTLEFEVDKLLSDRRNEDEFKASFSFEDKNGQDQVWSAKITMRGRFRRTRCTMMPPLKINFKKGALKEAGLAKFDDFKLVTQCIQDESQAREFLIKEYLAYKMYNQLTDYSYRVQLLKINFKDSQTGEVHKQWGFMIEDTAQLRDRVGAKKFDSVFKIEKELINTDLLKTVSLFQYMIGNLDWDVKARFHNTKPIEIDGRVYPIPYDFDFSGLVSASYAVVNPNYEVSSIKDRLYLGYEEDLKNSVEVIELFKAKEKAMIATVKECKILKRNSRVEMIQYIESFYDDLDNIKLPTKLTAN